MTIIALGSARDCGDESIFIMFTKLFNILFATDAVDNRIALAKNQIATLQDIAARQRTSNMDQLFIFV